MTDRVREAADRLARGGVVAFPTETVYGLGASAFDADAVRRVFALKGRPTNNPLIVHVSGVEMARTVVDDWPEPADRLTRRFWPGPLTIVLPKAPALPPEVTAGGWTVAVRAPHHPVALRLIEALGGPIVAPSANRSGRVSPTTADHVRSSFSREEVLTLDGGPCAHGIESTVVDLTRRPPRILRPGAATAEALGQLVPLEPAAGGGPTTGPARSPGSVGTHYAPESRLALFDGSDWPAPAEHAPQGTVVLTHHPQRRGGPTWRVERMPLEAEGYAAVLYATLRRVDAERPPLILVERPEHGAGLWSAIGDRLRRAAGA